MHPSPAATQNAGFLHKKAAILCSAITKTLLIGINIYTYGAKDTFFLKFLSFLIQTVTEIVFPPKYKVRTKNILVSILVIVLVIFIAIEQCKNSHLSHSLYIAHHHLVFFKYICNHSILLLSVRPRSCTYEFVPFAGKKIVCDYKFSHGYQDCGLLRHDTVYCGRRVQRFHRYLLPSSSTLQDGSSRL